LGANCIPLGILVQPNGVDSIRCRFWGALSDKVGRKPIVLLGTVGTIISLLAVGFSTNLWIALLGRAFGGALNGSMGVIQTMVGEMVKNPDHERELQQHWNPRR